MLLTAPQCCLRGHRLLPKDHGQGGTQGGDNYGAPGQQIGVNIANMDVNNGDGQAAARDINRNVNQYPFDTR